MNVKFLFVFGLLCASSMAFSQESSAKLAINVGVGGNYYFTGQASKLGSHYGIGGRIELVVNGGWTFGYSQHGSIRDGGLLKTETEEHEQLSLFEHRTGIGYKIPFYAGLYALPTANVGLGVLRTKRYHVSDWDEIKNEFSQAVKGAFFIAPEVKLGYGLHRYLAVETYVTYRRYVGRDIRPGIRTGDVDGLGVGLAIVGHIPLIH